MEVFFLLAAVDLLLPLMMLGIGLWMAKRPPARINHFVGYRTPRSMQNGETWLFAQRYCGRLWQRTGLALLPISALLMLCVYGRSEEAALCMGTAICLAQSAAMILAIPATERALRRAFPEEKARKCGKT